MAIFKRSGCNSRIARVAFYAAHMFAGAVGNRPYVSVGDYLSVNTLVTGG
jgi:hypothetical protein